MVRMSSRIFEGSLGIELPILGKLSIIGEFVGGMEELCSTDRTKG